MNNEWPWYVFVTRYFNICMLDFKQGSIYWQIMQMPVVDGISNQSTEVPTKVNFIDYNSF